MSRTLILFAVVFLLLGVLAPPLTAQCGPQEVGGLDELGFGVRPDVAVLADGSAIVAWASTIDGDGDRLAVLARRIGPTGLPSGDAFQVNTWIEQDQDSPRLAVSATGHLVIVWVSDTSPGDTSGTSVRARVYDPSGSPLGNDFRVNTSTGGSQRDADVAIDDEGNFVVVWYDDAASDGRGREVRAQLFNANGSLRGGEMLVNTLTDGTQQEPSVGMAPDGRFVVAWQSGTSGGNDNSSSSIQVRRFAADGSSLDNQEFQANSHTPDLQGDPSVAVDADGSFLIAWEARRSSPADDDQAFSVHARGFLASGLAAGAQMQLNQLIVDDQFDPRVAAVGGGEFLISFTSDAEVDFIARNVRGRTMTLAGEFRSPEFTVLAGAEAAGVGGNRGGRSLAVARQPGGAIVVQGFDHPCAPGGTGPTECQATDTDLCLVSDRFRVSVSWQDPFGNIGEGQARELTPDTGYFWFFSPSNVEMVLKVLDACSFGDRFWVFAGGLTDVAVEMEVEDMETGELRRYSNQLGTPFQPIQDTGAFATCP